MKSLRPPPGEAMIRAHAALLRDLRELKRLLAGAVEVTALRRRLERLQADLAEHFRCEEQGGYLEEVRQREPNRERVIEELAHEHGGLAQRLAAILVEVGGTPAVGEGLREKVRDWVNAVREHEARENQLVQDAFNLDLGPED